MDTAIKEVLEYGVLLAIAGIFLYDWLKNKDRVNDTLKQNTKILGELSNTNANISKTLDLLQTSMDLQRNMLVEHDNRSVKIEHQIETMLNK